MDKADPDPAPEGGGSFVQRQRARLQAARSRRSAKAIVRRLVADPPQDLAGLQRLVGGLDFDPDGPEGRGAGLFRPASPFPTRAGPPGTDLGDLRPGVVRLFAGFEMDLYHGQPRNPALLRVDSVSLSLDMDRDDVRAILERAHGPSRSIDRDGGDVLESGRWYYLEPSQRPSAIAWHRRRPDWALPPVDTGAPAAFLAALAAVLAGPAAPAAGAPDLVALGDAAGATVTHSDDRLSVSARPGLPMAAVAGAFGWDAPVAGSTDVHMSHWTVGQRNPATGGPARTRIGRWTVETWLGGRPRGAPELRAAGPSPVYDLRDHAGPVVGLLASAADDDPA